MIQKFIQTDTTVIDISRLEYIDLLDDGQARLWFAGGNTTVLSAVEAEQLMDAIADLDRSKVLVARRAALASGAREAVMQNYCGEAHQPSQQDEK